MRMSRILLLLPTATYRAADFMAAAKSLGVEVVVGSEHPQAMAAMMGDTSVVVPIDDLEAAVEAICALHSRSRLDAVLAVDDRGIVAASEASERLGLPHNPPEAVRATRDKAVMRALLAAASIPQPAFVPVKAGVDPTVAAAEVGYPCVVKPVSLSASQGVIRAEDLSGLAAALKRVRALVGSDETLLVEGFVPGDEVAVEGILVAGALQILAVFDKPDPLDGPYFEETIYVTPSRHPAQVLAAIERLVADAATAIGLREGPLHAEVRIGPAGDVRILEVAARSIGGLCSRALRFGAGISLEELILRHAIGAGIGGLSREKGSSGVMMLPIRSDGVLRSVSGLAEARRIEGVTGLEITIPIGRRVVPLPEGDRYLGFVFARGERPAQVEASLRAAEATLEVVIGS